MYTLRTSSNTWEHLEMKDLVLIVLKKWPNHEWPDDDREFLDELNSLDPQGIKVEREPDRVYYDPQFYGFDTVYHYYGIGVGESVISFAKEYGAFWILDMIASYSEKLREKPFSVLTVDVDGNSAIFEAREDSDEPPFIRQEIEFTDLACSVKFFFSDNVLMFPSDY